MEAFSHQKQFLADRGREKAWALFWEQGTGKTWAALANAELLRDAGEVDAVLVLAPNGVHLQWALDQGPLHFPDLGKPYLAYSTPKASGKLYHQVLRNLLDAPFPVVCMSYDSVMTDKGAAWVRRFLGIRRVLLVLDESTAVKTPGARRTQRVVRLGLQAPYRRILTGTPTTNSPFDIYSQLKFLDWGFWRRHELDDYSVFKAFFGVWAKGFNRTQNREFQYVAGYQHLDELREMVASISSRLLKEDVLDLPPKLYAKRYFEMSAPQRRAYEELRDETLTVLKGETITAHLAIVRLLRLQQVTCNYLPVDGQPCAISMSNPRLDCLVSLVEDLGHQAIVWCRFQADVSAVCAALGQRAVRYDGLVNDEQRARAKAAFLAGDAQVFVSNPAVAGKGHNFTNAKTVVYYSNSFDLEHRLQSEDRAHRAGQTTKVEYVDIVAPRTVDEHIVRNLRAKRNLAAGVTGDELKEWL